MDLKERVAIVTGASSGIGVALARALSRAGARVVLAARRRERLEENAAGCPGETLVVAVDVADAAGRARLVSETVGRWGRIDVLVNNAGIGAYGDLGATTEAGWRRLFDVNVFAPVLLTQAVLPGMLKRREGVVVNVASIGGLLAHGDKLTQYVASKHALVGFSRALARDLEGSGVRVIAVCPHLTDTELFLASDGGSEMADVIEKHRSFMDTPEDVAQGIVEKLDCDRVIVFPTPKPQRAYEKHRDI